MLREPSLCLSLYFKADRSEYYDRLQRVRLAGNWEGWLRFFFTGVIEAAHQATTTARDLWAIFEQDRRRIQEEGKIAGTALRAHDWLQLKLIVSIAAVCKALELTHPPVIKSLRRLEEMGVVREMTGRQRGRLYV